jgi:glucosyl-dolichyl phosphate glucuronosyltransferase
MSVEAPKPRITLSVAICTRNRAGMLAQTLDAMASGLRLPAGVGWELLVVDNGSTDDTDRVLDAFAVRLPIRRLFEPEQGLSRARNLAVCHARGDYVIWTDDDVLVDPDWLEAYHDAFLRRPEAAVFGGVIEPCFPGGIPAWLEKGWAHVQGAYAVRDLGPQEVLLAPGRLPYGANMAVRMDEQRRYLYDVNLGYSGDDRMGGEDTAVLGAILADGGTGWWVPGSRVKHVIPHDRTTLEYLQAYFFGLGRYHHANPRSPRWWRKGSWGWKLQRLVAQSAYGLGRVLNRPALWVWGLTRAWIARGYLHQTTRCSAIPGQPPALLAVVPGEDEHQRQADGEDPGQQPERERRGA